jgi:hypothetical protein
MKITKHLTTTNSYEESFTITDELLNAFKSTLSEEELKWIAEEGLSEFEDELFEFAWKQYHVEGNTTITQYEETDTVLHGEYDGYTIND